MRGLRVERGQKLGSVVDPSRFEFVAVVNQDDASPFFEAQVRGAEIRLPGEAGTKLEVGEFEIIPSQQHALPSPALGMAGGGTIEVDAGDGTGRVAREPFFIVRASVRPRELAPRMLHQRTGVIRFDLPPEPLARQWARAFRQLLQRRFQI